MKPYHVVIDRLAKEKLNKYLRGANDTRVDGVALVAWLYSTTCDKVHLDVDQVFNTLLYAQQQQYGGTR
jgi:hypothetical protein